MPLPNHSAERSSGGDDSASTSLSRPSSLSHAAAINTNNYASAMKTRKQMVKSVRGNSSSLTMRPLQPAPFLPCHLLWVSGLVIIHNIGDGKFDSVEDDHTVCTATTRQKKQSTGHASSKNNDAASSTTIADLSIIRIHDNRENKNNKPETTFLGRHQQVWDANSIPPFACHVRNSRPILLAINRPCSFFSVYCSFIPLSVH